MKNPESPFIFLSVAILSPLSPHFLFPAHKKPPGHDSQGIIFKIAVFRRGVNRIFGHALARPGAGSFNLGHPVKPMP